MKRAEVRDGVIVNIVEVEGQAPAFMADWPEVTGEGLGWVLDGAAFVRPATGETIEALRTAASAAILADLNAVADRATGGYLRMEVVAWSAKAADARAIVAGGEVSALIAAEAALLGEAPAALAARIVVKAVQYEQLIAVLAALRQTHAQAVLQAATPEAVAEALTAARTAIAAL